MSSRYGQASRVTAHQLTCIQQFNSFVFLSKLMLEAKCGSLKCHQSNVVGLVNQKHAGHPILA